MAKAPEIEGGADERPKQSGGRSAVAARAARKVWVERLVAATGDTARTVGELFREVGAPIDRTLARVLARKVILLARNPGALDAAEVAAVHAVSRAGAAAALGDDEVLAGLLHRLAHTRKARAHTFTELIKAVPTNQTAAFRAALTARAKERRWPSGVGALQASRTVLVFLLADVVGLAPPPPPSPHPPAFDQAFDRAFDALRGPRGLNLVPLSALRRALAAWDRDGFDRELHALRAADRVVLHTFDGRHGKLDPDEGAAAIVEGGRRFVYAARRDP